MSNYTKPNDENHNDHPNDWLLSTLMFARALGLTIPEGQGVVIELTGDMIDLLPDIKKVIIENIGDKITVERLPDDTNLEEGDWVEIIKPENIIN